MSDNPFLLLEIVPHGKTETGRESRKARLPWVGIFGAIVVGAFTVVFAFVFHKLLTKYKPREYAKMNFIQYGLMHFFMFWGVLFLPPRRPPGGPRGRAARWTPF